MLFKAMGSAAGDKKPSFTRLSDHFNTAAKAGLAYAAFTGIEMATNPAFSPNDYLAIPVVFAMLRVRYLREIPMALGNLLFMPFLARDKHAAPPEMQSITDEFAEKAGYSYRIKTYVYNKGATKNAFSVGDRLYVGKDLAEGMDREELRFVLGHEMAHSTTQDISESYLFWPPWVSGILATVAAATTFLLTPNPVTLAVAGIAYANWKFQSAVSNSHSRQLEFRADRNGLQFCGNLEAARSALMKLLKMNGRDVESEMSPERKSDMFSSHPCLRERIENLDREYELMRQPPGGPPPPG